MATPVQIKPKTPIASIRAKCIDCCGGNQKEPAMCPAPECDLWPYRFGRRPTPEMVRKHLKALEALEARRNSNG